MAEIDPTDAMSYYKRALVRTALGQTTSVLTDLSAALSADPGFGKARLRRASLHMSMGSFDAAGDDCNAILSSSSSSPDESRGAEETLGKVRACANLASAGRAAAKAGHYANARDRLGEAIECAGKDPSLRMLRAEAYAALGEVEAAIGDASRASKLQKSDLSPVLLLARLHWGRGDIDDALNHVRACLQSDQGHKACRALYKTVRAVKKAWDKGSDALDARDWETAELKYDFALNAQGLAPAYVPDLALGLARALVGAGGNRIRDAIAALDRGLAARDAFLDAFVLKADLLLQLEEFQDAVHTLNKARQHFNQNQAIASKLREAERLLKISLRKDYYKILGVSKSASERDVSKAYRKLARQWHPDKWKTDEEKAKAEEMFKDIARGKEILSDPEMRARYDRGEDPEDPNGGGGGHPHGGGFPFNTHFTFRRG